MARIPKLLDDIHNEELIVLVELDAFDESGREVYLTFSTKTFIPSPNESYANVIYDGRITTDFTLNYNMLSNDKASGVIKPDVGNITIANADGKYDNLIKYVFDGLGVRILLGYPSLLRELFIPIFIGTQFTPVFTLNTIEFRLRDNLELMRSSLLTTAYLGPSTPLNGNKYDIQDKKIAMIFGRNLSLNLTCVDIPNNIYHTGIPGHNIEHLNPSVNIINVYDKGNEIVRESDYTTQNDLLNTPPSPGCYRVWHNGLDGSYVRLGSKPIGQTSTHCKVYYVGGEASDLPIICRMVSLTTIGYDNFSTTAFDSLSDNIINNIKFGLYIDSDLTGLDALSQILASVKCYLTTDATGQFICRMQSEVSSNYTVELNQSNSKLMSIDNANDNIINYLILNYNKNHTVQNDLSEAVTDDIRGFMSLEYRKGAVNDEHVKEKHRLSTQYEGDTLVTTMTYTPTDEEFTNLANELHRQFDLLKKDRMQITVAFTKLNLHIANHLIIGEDVLVKINRLGLDDGLIFKVIGYEPNFTKGTAVIKLWR